VFVIIDVRPGVVVIPTTAYEAVEEVESGEGKEIQRVFKHVPCSIEAEEAEEVCLCLCLIAPPLSPSD
jgi:26S proteasome regulatory subunit N8